MDERIARLNVTYGGANGDLPDGVAFDTPEADILRMVEESLRDGYITGIPATPDANLRDFEVVRFSGDDGSNLGDRIFVRPKTPFGF